MIFETIPAVRRNALALASVLAAALFLPGAAAAHAVSGIDYRFPLPVWLAVHDAFLDTLLMVAIVGAFVLAFLAVVGIVSRLEPASLADAARRYAPTLIPIAAVYFVSHYFLYIVYAGQFTAAAALDPFGREWVPDVESPWRGVSGELVWYLQVGLIVWGHVVAVFEAHRVSLGVQGARRRATLAQAPLVLLMVGYTFTGLWVLGQVLAAA